MNLQALVDRASSYDSKLQITVWDNTEYKSGKSVKREVRVRVYHADNGEGSLEDIVIRMGVNALKDQVLQIVPGKTNQWWQVEPLTRALREDADLAIPEAGR